jgi:hypothetical protein
VRWWKRSTSAGHPGATQLQVVEIMWGERLFFKRISHWPRPARRPSPRGGHAGVPRRHRIGRPVRARNTRALLGLEHAGPVGPRGTK